MCNTVDIWQVGDKRRVWLPTDSEQYLTQHASRASDLCDNFAQTKEHKNYRNLATTCKNYQTMMALTISLNINCAFLPISLQIYNLLRQELLTFCCATRYRFTGVLLLFSHSPAPQCHNSNQDHVYIQCYCNLRNSAPCLLIPTDVICLSSGTPTW